MLKETYLSNLKNLPPGVRRVRVCRPSILAPSAELLALWKNGKLTWEGYVEQFRLELLARKGAYARMAEIAKSARDGDVYLYCYERDNTHCHRSILLEIIGGMG